MMKEYDIRDYGAVGDGVTLNTAAIQKTIDECASKGGGRVLISEGSYVTGTIHMRSYVELCVEANAVLKASTDGDDYPDFSCKEWNTKAAPRASAKCLIYFGYIENASLTGMGKIDCNGSAFCDPVYDENGNLVFDDIEGMPFETAMHIRNMYSDNVGTILVVFNDQQLKAALADNRVDFIIPFHRSQWKKAQSAGGLCSPGDTAE